MNRRAARRGNVRRGGPTDKGELLRALLLGDLRRLFRHRYGFTFPDDDAGLEDLTLLLFVHSLALNWPREKMRLAIRKQAPWLSEAQGDDLIR